MIISEYFVWVERERNQSREDKPLFLSLKRKNIYLYIFPVKQVEVKNDDAV